MWLDKQAQKNVERQTWVLKDGKSWINFGGRFDVFESDVLGGDGSNSFQFCKIQMGRRHARRHNNPKAVWHCISYSVSVGFLVLQLQKLSTFAFLVTTVTIAFLAIWQLQHSKLLNVSHGRSCYINLWDQYLFVPLWHNRLTGKRSSSSKRITITIEAESLRTKQQRKKNQFPSGAHILG